jgi:hypothetical protein
MRRFLTIVLQSWINGKMVRERMERGRAFLCNYAAKSGAGHCLGGYRLAHVGVWSGTGKRYGQTRPYGEAGVF